MKGKVNATLYQEKSSPSGYMGMGERFYFPPFSPAQVAKALLNHIVSCYANVTNKNEKDQSYDVCEHSRSKLIGKPGEPHKSHH